MRDEEEENIRKKEKDKGRCIAAVYVGGQGEAAGFGNAETVGR